MIPIVVRQIVYLSCIIASYKSLVIGDNENHNNFFKKFLAPYDMFDNESRSSQEENIKDLTINRKLSAGTENHKELAEDVLRHLMTAYFSLREAGFHCQKC